MARCKSCNAPIAWLKTENGKSIPINPGRVFVREAYPDEQGDTLIIHPSGMTATGIRIDEAEYNKWGRRIENEI